MFIISHETIDIIAEVKQSEVLIYWWITHPVTSYVNATFHPTIGQRAHQSLRNTAHPKLGMIPQGIRNQQAYTQTKYTNQPANTVGFIRLSRSWEKLNAKLGSSWKS